MDNHSKNSSIYLEISLLALLIEGNEKTDTNIMSQTGLYTHTHACTHTASSYSAIHRPL